MSLSKAIWKFPHEIKDSFTLGVPKGATFVALQLQHGIPTLWALVDTNAIEVKREFVYVGTGHEHPHDFWSDLEFVGTIQMGLLVFHLFERR